MNISETDFTNITGYDLNKSISKELFLNSVQLIISMLSGLLLNYGALKVCISKSTKSDKFGIILLALFDSTVSVVGALCGVLLNTYPVNFFDNSLCAFMLGSNMLLANLSVVCILNLITYRYILFRYPLYQISNKKRMCVTVAGMLFTTILSIPSFILYGETDIVMLVQNTTFSGKMCGISRIVDNETSEIYDNGTSGTSGNGTLIQIYPIAMKMVYVIVTVYLGIIQMHLTVLFFRGLKKRRQNPFVLNVDSKIQKRVKIMDCYADKDVSVLDSDALVCSSCDELVIKTTNENNSDKIMKSAYEKMLDINISMTAVSENTNLIDDTSNNHEDSNSRVLWQISQIRCITWYFMQFCVLLSFAVSVLVRAEYMFVKSNILSDVSDIELSWKFIDISVVSSAANPLYYSLFAPISSINESFVLFFQSRMNIIRKKRK